MREQATLSRRQWRIACAALHAHDLDCVSRPDLANDRAHDALGERLFTEEQHLFDLVMATPARTLQGLEVKGQALARAFDVLAPGTGPIETARERVGDIEVHSALTLALDILRLARTAA